MAPGKFRHSCLAGALLGVVGFAACWAKEGEPQLFVDPSSDGSMESVPLESGNSPSPNAADEHGSTQGRSGRTSNLASLCSSKQTRWPWHPHFALFMPSVGDSYLGRRSIPGYKWSWGGITVQPSTSAAVTAMSGRSRIKSSSASTFSSSSSSSVRADKFGLGGLSPAKRR
jgi:hypothetical protein